MTKAVLERVLYIEDDPDIRLVATMSLELIGGLSVRACSGYAEAAAVDDFEPDLMLIDVMMPDVDGPETLARLRRLDRFAGVPAMFFTAKVRPEEITRLLKLGAIGVVAKPFDPQNLADALRREWDCPHLG